MYCTYVRHIPVGLWLSQQLYISYSYVVHVYGNIDLLELFSGNYVHITIFCIARETDMHFGNCLISRNYIYLRFLVLLTVVFACCHFRESIRFSIP